MLGILLGVNLFSGLFAQFVAKRWASIVAGLTGITVFFAVLSGTIRATGAPPGGVLGGKWAFWASLMVHALHGALETWLIIFGWAACLGFIFSIIGACRRRRPWTAPLRWIAVLVVSGIAVRALDALFNWLGSASPGVWDGAQTWSPPYWDAAAFWGTNALVATAMLLSAPTFFRGLWHWCNGGPLETEQLWLRVPQIAIGTAIGFVPIVLALSIVRYFI